MIVNRSLVLLWTLLLTQCELCSCFNFVEDDPSNESHQTHEQRKVVRRAREESMIASPASEEDVFQLFDSPATRRYLREMDDGSKLYTLPTTDLISMFWKEISVAELVHSFGDGASEVANCGYDLNISIGRKSRYFYNLWQLQSLGYVPVDNETNPYTEYTETQIFHYPPFRDATHPDSKTANDRPIYASLNMYRGSGGNPQCGPIAAVFSRKYISDRILASPIDTGTYYGGCSRDGTAVAEWWNHKMGICSAWPPQNHLLGNPPYLNHLVQPYLTFYNHSQAVAGSDYPYWNLARLLIRLLSRVTYGANNNNNNHQSVPTILRSSSSTSSGMQKSRGSPLNLNFLENTLGYFEFDLAMTISLSDGGIKMMVGMFELLWGTSTGVQLRQWCVERGWSLAWAFNPTMSFFRCGSSGDAPQCVVPSDITMGIDSANVRILDPWVMANVPAGYNMSISKSQIAEFENLWNNLGVVGSTMSTSPSQGNLHTSWLVLNTLFSSSLGVEPLFFGACSDEDCIGVTIHTQECVCPPSSS